ncbi:MAG: DUF6062 family protein [Clostridia bacterium]|nr:DUF6062 family protein [Clostridia bacterium]
MAEQIYTIPINESFDASLESEKPKCPLCALYSMLEKNALEAVMGAAMMEPDVRIETNRKGFCKRHFAKMYSMGNRLGLGLILESHVAEVEKNIFSQGTLFDPKSEKEQKKLTSLDQSCYVCDKANDNFGRLMSNAIYMWENEDDFRRKYSKQTMFCLPHYKTLLEYGNSFLGKKDFAEFFKDTRNIMQNYIKSLGEDVSWFCKKFDYRYDKEPWYNAKDAVPRSIAFLSGNDEINE